MTIRINGKTIEIDNEGFLLDPEDWSMDVAKHIACIESLELNEDRLEIVHFVRNFFEESHVVPEARTLLKALREVHGKERATRKYVYNLFPYGYGQQACKIAGMRKPLKLMLDI